MNYVRNWPLNDWLTNILFFLWYHQLFVYIFVSIFQDGDVDCYLSKRLTKDLKLSPSYEGESVLDLEEENEVISIVFL